MQRLLLGALILLSPMRVLADTQEKLNPILQKTAKEARFAIVPLVPEASGKIDALYTALRSQGAWVVGASERVGIDRNGSDLISRAHSDDVKVLLIKSQQAMRSFELERAQDLSAEALSLLWRLDSPTDHKDLIADTILLRASLLLSVNQKAKAERELLLLSRLDKTRTALHPGLYPPSLVEAFEKAMSSTSGQADALLTLHASLDSSVFIDGEAVISNTPFEIRPGPHLLHISAPGRLAQSRWIDLKPAEARSIFCFCPPSQVVQKRQNFVASLIQNRNDQNAKELAALMGANALILTSPKATYLWSEASSFLNVLGKNPLEKARYAIDILERSQKGAPTINEQSHTLAWVGGAAAITIVAAGTALSLWYGLGPTVEAPPQVFIIDASGQ